MTVFLDIGAKRIQAYLARTPRLRGRRGASALLDHERIVAWTKPAWKDDATINRAGKETDGILSLQLLDPNPAEDAVLALIDEITALLRRLAPGAEWEVYTRRATDYRQALSDSEAADRAGHALLPGNSAQYLPLPAAAAEVPVVRFCDTCGVDAAVVSTDRVDLDEREPLSICADCSRRFLEGGYRTDRSTWTLAEGPLEWQAKIQPGGLRAERDLRHEVQKQIGRRLDVVATFEELAALGSGDANHLCTVFIDGNRFGDLFGLLKNTDVSLNDLSRDLGSAMSRALAEATTLVTDDNTPKVPVVPHLLGGDDLLASVTADRAWDFVLTFLTGYHVRVAELARLYGERASLVIEPPTASVGMVFAHVTRPFADCLDLAEDNLRRAKARYNAEVAAVCWLDITADGPALPAGRAVPTLAVLQQHRAQLDELTHIPPAGHAALIETTQRGEVAVAALAYRMGRTKAISPFLNPYFPIPLADALNLVRWWQCRKPV